MDLPKGWKEALEWVRGDSEFQDRVQEKLRRPVMPYVFAERRNPNGAGKQRLYGFDNGFGLCVEGGISEEWDVRLIWFAGGPGVVGRFRDRNSGKFKYEDITGRHPNFKEPLYGATLPRVNQTAEWVQSWMAPIGEEPWSAKEAKDRAPQDRSGAIERQDVGEVAGQQGVADGDRQELTRKLTGQNQSLAEVSKMMAEAQEEAILDAFYDKAGEAAVAAVSLQKQQQAKLKQKLKQNFQERERELAARKNEILRNQGLAERATSIETKRRFARSSDQTTASAAQAAADRRNVFLQTLIGEYDRKVVAAGIVYISGICKDLEEGIISDRDAVQLVEGAPAGLSAVSRDLLREFYASGQAFTRIDENPNPLIRGSPGIFQGVSIQDYARGDSLAALSFSLRVQAESQNPLFFVTQGMVGNEERVTRTDKAFIQKIQALEERLKAAQITAQQADKLLDTLNKEKLEELIRQQQGWGRTNRPPDIPLTKDEVEQAMGRALEEGQRTGVYVDPETGLGFEAMQKEAKELLAQRKAEEKKKKLKTRRQKVEGLTTEAEDHPEDLPPKSKRRVLRIEGDDHADSA